MVVQEQQEVLEILDLVETVVLGMLLKKVVLLVFQLFLLQLP